MLAKDVMTKKVTSVPPETHIRDVAMLLLKNRISAVPVVDTEGKLLGIVSEGDLMRRGEIGTERHPSWWLELASSPGEKAFSYIKSHGVHASNVMTKKVVTVDENTELEKIAEILERKHIKRVPVLSGGKLVGIVSRADLIRGLATLQTIKSDSARTDRELRDAVEKAIAKSGATVRLISVVVSDGVVSLWGAAESATEKEAIKVAAESVSGVKDIEDKINVLPQAVRAVLWAE